MAFDPSQPLQVSVQLESPHYVTFAMWYKRPEDPKWISFAGGNDDESARLSSHEYEIGMLPSGSLLYYFFHFAGNIRTAYRATVALKQNRQAVGAATVLSGITNEKGMAKKEKEVRLS